uniref:(northern house mosquito) hypothetical protein n=1 Tax=Culex pipiens TaxID=7175 RepID=A0A8D8P1U7_CULPI
MKAICSECKKEFKAVDPLLNHLKNKQIHGKTKKSEFKCAQIDCGIGFSDSGVFRKHLNIVHKIPMYESESEEHDTDEETGHVTKRLRIDDEPDQVAGPSRYV